MREKKVCVSVAVGVVVALSGAAHGQVLAAEEFDFVGLLTDNGWTAHSGAGNKAQTSNGDYVTLDQSGGSGEDTSLPFAVQGAADKVYAGFDLRVLTADLSSPLLDGSGLYLAHFKDSGFAFRARTGVVQPSGGGDWGLAINADNSDLGAGATWATDLTFDTWYRVIISWDAGTGESELWVDPSLETDTSIMHTGGFTGDLMEAFSLRQSNDYTGFNHVDNVVVGKSFQDVLVIPTPGALSLLGVGGLLAMRRRRS